MERRDFTRFLPFELVLSVIGHLDHFSLMSLLEAIPSLKKETVFITDHHFPPMFTTVQGLKRRYLPSECPHHHDVSLYNVSRDSKPIKILELTYLGQLSQRILEEEDPGITKPEQLVYLNLTSFVFVNLLEDGNERIAEAIERSDRNVNGSKWFIGHNTLPSKDYCASSFEGLMKSESCPEMLTGSPCSMNLSSVTKGVELLYIDNTTTFKDHTFPVLQSLTVVFPNSFCEISDITIPKLSDLVVHYNTTPPLIRNIHFGQGPRDHPRGRLSTFELSDISQLSSNRSSSCHPSVGKVVSLCEFSFMQHFRVVTLTGVPFEVFEAMDVTNTTVLNYRITIPDTRVNKKSISFPTLVQAWLTIEVESLQLPIIVPEWICTIHLTLLAKYVDITDFMFSTSGLYLSVLRIYRAPWLASSDSNDIMSPEHWTDWFEKKGKRLLFLTLSGFSMPFIHLTAYQPPLLLSALVETRLRPTLDNSTLDLFTEDVIYINTLSSRPWERNYFIFEPMIISKKLRLWCSRSKLVLVMDVTDLTNHNYPSILVSPGFQSYALDIESAHIVGNGPPVPPLRDLPMVTSQWWKSTHESTQAQDELYTQIGTHRWLPGYQCQSQEPEALSIVPGVSLHYVPIDKSHPVSFRWMG